MKVPSGFRALANSTRQPAAGAAPGLASDPAETMTATIVVRRRPDAPPLPDPTSRGGRLARGEFARRYGASEADLDAVAEFAHNHGLSIVEHSAARRTVVVSGTVGQMNDAFGVVLEDYRSPDQTYRSFTGQVVLPESCAGLVEAVFGLDNRRVARPAVAHADTSATPATTTALTPPPGGATL